MSAKLATSEIIVETCRLVYHRRNDLLRVGLVFTFGFFALGVFMVGTVLPLLHGVAVGNGGELAGNQRYLPAMFILILVIEFLLIAIFAIGWHRLVLLGPARAGGGLGIALGARELRYFSRMWLCFLGLVALGFAVAQVEVVIATLLQANLYGFLLAASFGYFLLAAFLLARISPAFAALSVDLPASFLQAWRSTAGNGFQLLAIYLLIFLGWFFLTVIFSALSGLLGLGAAAPYALLFIGTVMTCCQMAMLVTANALAFRRLSGRTGPA
jgi:hypothetical protein